MKNWTFYIMIAFLLLLAFVLYRFSMTQKQSSVSKSCASCTGHGSLLPITDPAFNLREVSKQMILLEDHLLNKGKLCEQCIIKHSLTIEGYLEEALCLDSNDEYCDEVNDILEKFRAIEHCFISGVSPQKLAHKLRDVRKKIHVKYFTVSI